MFQQQLKWTRNYQPTPNRNHKCLGSDDVFFKNAQMLSKQEMNIYKCVNSS